MTLEQLSYVAPQRYKTLQFIRSELEQGHPFPSSDAIAHHLGWKNRTSSHAAKDVLDALTASGFLSREREKMGRRRYIYSLKPEFCTPMLEAAE